MAPLLIILNAMEIASRKKEMNIEKDRYTLWVDQNLKYIAVPHLVSVKVCICYAQTFPTCFIFIMYAVLVPKLVHRFDWIIPYLIILIYT